MFACMSRPARSQTGSETIRTDAHQLLCVCFLHLRAVFPYTILESEWEGGVVMGIVVVRSPKCLKGLLRRLFGLKEEK